MADPIYEELNTSYGRRTVAVLLYVNTNSLTNLMLEAQFTSGPEF